MSGLQRTKVYPDTIRKSIHGPSLTKSAGLADDNVTTIAVDEDFIWFGTQNAGVSLYSNTEQTFVKTYTRTDLLETDKINYILVDGLYCLDWHRK